MEYQEIKTLKGQVEDCLKNWPETRNSDKALTIKLWTKFYPQHIFVAPQLGGVVKLDSIMDLPSQDGIKRIRAKFQNEGKVYLPTDWKIAEGRGIAEDEWRVAMGYPTKESTGTDSPSWKPPSVPTKTADNTPIQQCGECGWPNKNPGDTTLYLPEGQRPDPKVWEVLYQAQGGSWAVRYAGKLVAIESQCRNCGCALCEGCREKHIASC